MGAKFAVITATHETGFAIYQSDVNPYSMKALKWSDGKGDIVSDFVKSCRKYDIQPGIYIGIRWNSLFGIHNFKAEGDVKGLEEFGARVEELTAHPLKSTAGTGKIINLSLDKCQFANQIIVQENIAKGERIRKYKVEGLTRRGWKTLCEGESVGYKRIQAFEPVEVSRARLTIEQQIDVPQIRNFSIFNVNL